MGKTAIIGIGNILMGDEGVGVHAVEYLRGKVRNVNVLDCGTGGISLLHILERYDDAMIIDAADFGGEAGEIRSFVIARPQGRSNPVSSGDCFADARNDTHFISLTDDNIQISLHETGFAGILELAKKIGVKMPKITLITVQPDIIEYRMELSKKVKEALPKILELITLQLNSHTAPPVFLGRRS